MGKLLTSANENAVGRAHMPSTFIRQSTEVRDLETEYDIDIPTDAGFETLAGFLLYRLGYIPHIGEHVEYGGRRYTVLDMERNRISRVRVEKVAGA